jgi:hypothetical protein
LRLPVLNGGSRDGALLGSPYNKMAVQLGLRELVFMKDLVQVPFNGPGRTYYEAANRAPLHSESPTGNP